MGPYRALCRAVYRALFRALFGCPILQCGLPYSRTGAVSKSLLLSIGGFISLPHLRSEPRTRSGLQQVGDKGSPVGDPGPGWRPPWDLVSEARSVTRDPSRTQDAETATQKHILPGDGIVFCACVLAAMTVAVVVVPGRIHRCV